MDMFGSSRYDFPLGLRPAELHIMDPVLPLSIEFTTKPQTLIFCT